MPDIVAPQVRSRMMAGIKGYDTKPELILRMGLHQAGFRYRLHARELPGKPDLVFPKYRAIIFVHGCFWHGHECALFKWPSTRQDFWRQKITGNVARDRKVKEQLLSEGWRVLTVWECALKGRGRLPSGELITRSVAWLRSHRKVDETRGSR